MTILDKAAEIVDGPRQDDYGHPEINHGRTALLWNAYLEAKHFGRRQQPSVLPLISTEDVCFLNILQKIARGLNGVTDDTLVDIAGYARNVELIQKARGA